MNIKRWISVPLALSLMLFSFGVASAQEDAEVERTGFAGTVVSYDAGTGILVLSVLAEGETASSEITISVASDVIKIPGDSGVLEEGAKVVVLAHQPEGEDQWVADSLVVKPVKPISPPIVGAVVSRETDAQGIRFLTIMRRDGTTKTIQLRAGDVAPEEGELVTAFAGPPDDDDRGGRPVLTGLMKADDVRARLNKHLADSAGNPDLPEQARSRLVDDLATTLGAFVSRQVTLLENIKARAPAAAQQGLDTALANARRGRDQAQANAAVAREKAGPPQGRGQPDGTPGAGSTGDTGSSDDRGRPDGTPEPENEEPEEEGEGDEGEGRPSDAGSQGQSGQGQGGGS